MSKLTLENIYEDYNKKDRNQINRINELQNSLERESERVSQLLKQVKFGDNSCLSACEIRQVVDDRIETVLNNADIYLQSVNQSVLGTLTFVATDPEVPPIDVNLCPHVQYCETDTTLAKVPASLSLSYSAEKHTDTVDLSSWFIASNIFWSGSVTGFPNSNVQDMLDDVIGDANLPVDCTYFSGSQGNAITLSLDDLSDVNTIGLPINIGDYLRWDGNNWVPSPTTTPFNCSMLDSCSLPSGSGDSIFESVNSDTLIREKSNINQYNRDFVIGSPSLDATGSSSHYSKMFFNKSKAAFRAGWVNDTDWDDLNVGNYSAGFGVSNLVSGQHAFSAGSSNEATDNSSIALGYGNKSNGTYSFAEGQNTQSTSNCSHSEGNGCIASASSAHAEGFYTEASANYSHSSGRKSKAYLNSMYAHSSGSFVGFGGENRGQYSRSILLNSVNNNTPQELTIGNTVASTTTRLTIPAETSWGFEARVIVRQVSGSVGTVGDTHYFKVEGAIKRDGSNNTIMVGSPIVSTIVSDAGASSWILSATADDVNESLKFVVTGETNKNLRLSASVKLNEIN